MEQETKPKIRVRKHEKLIDGVLYITTQKAAEIMGVSRNCVLFYARLPKNNLRHLKWGQQRLFRREWIKDFLEERIK